MNSTAKVASADTFQTNAGQKSLADRLDAAGNGKFQPGQLVHTRCWGACKFVRRAEIRGTPLQEPLRARWFRHFLLVEVLDDPYRSTLIRNLGTAEVLVTVDDIQLDEVPA